MPKNDGFKNNVSDENVNLDILKPVSKKLPPILNKRSRRL